jgi:hypothetical protein
MNSIFQFGEKIDGYNVRVMNEREVRASAGIVFFFAMIAFMNAWLTGNFLPTRIFVVAFLIDFSIRLFVNPKYAPSMVLGRLAVRNQTPEYVGAPQKRFAWGIGLALAISMFYLVVVNRIVGPVNLIVCSICLLLLFFEAAFGICLGCKIYNAFHKEKAELCPGDVCEVRERQPIQKIGLAQTAMVALFLVVMGSVGNKLTTENSATSLHTALPDAQPQNDAASDKCKVPEWAASIGHAEKWKLHNNCK